MMRDICGISWFLSRPFGAFSNIGIVSNFKWLCHLLMYFAPLGLN